MTQKLPVDVQNNIKSLLAAGLTYSAILSRVPGLKKSTLSRYSKKFFPERVVLAPGRKSICSDTTMSYIRKQVISGGLKSAKDVHRYLDDTGHKMTYSATLKMLKNMGFNARIKKAKPLLSKRHMKLRLEWAMSHINWTSDDWRRMVFSDETKINRFSSDGCKWYWSRKEDSLKPHHLDLTVKGGGGSLMMWGCITYDGPGYACWIHDGTMKATDYVNILETTMMDSLKYYEYKPEDIYFQQDNDPKHTSKLAKQWFKDKGFDTEHTYSWPAQSPDLNPIEHVWHHLKLKLSAYKDKPAGVHELWERVEKEWSTITRDDCRRYINSMPARCQAVIDAKGGHTRY